VSDSATAKPPEPGAAQAPSSSAAAARTASLARAAQAMREGRTDEAERLCIARLRLDPRDVDVLMLLADLAGRTDRRALQLGMLERAAGLAPTRIDVQFAHGTALKQSSQPAAAAEAFAAVVRLDKSNVEAQYALGGCLSQAGDRDGAIAAFQAVLKAAPDHGATRHILAALTGETPDAPPDSYVRDLFDGYAAHFEAHLRDRLGYGSPERLFGLFDRLAPAARRMRHMIDIGCGTGLCARAFSSRLDLVTGIDLSPNMLAESRGTGLYHRLLEGEAASVLESLASETGMAADGSLAEMPQPDLFVAADTLIYVGRPDRLFRAIRAVASPDAWLLFDTERLESVAPGDPRPFRLTESGRYAHSAPGIETSLRTAGFNLMAAEDHAIRSGTGGPVIGRFYAATCRPL